MLQYYEICIRVLSAFCMLAILIIVLTIGEDLYLLRKLLGGWTQAELAEAVGRATRTIEHWEAEDYPVPAAMLFRLQALAERDEVQRLVEKLLHSSSPWIVRGPAGDGKSHALIHIHHFDFLQYLCTPNGKEAS
jgi:hypothetical protein